VLRLNAEVLRANALVVELVKADRWNGILPQTLLDGAGITRFSGSRGRTTPVPSDDARPARLFTDDRFADRLI
jgi:hypothetical protein